MTCHCPTYNDSKQKDFGSRTSRYGITTKTIKRKLRMEQRIKELSERATFLKLNIESRENEVSKLKTELESIKNSLMNVMVEIGLRTFTTNIHNFILIKPVVSAKIDKDFKQQFVDWCINSGNKHVLSVHVKTLKGFVQDYKDFHDELPPYTSTYEERQLQIRRRK